MAAPETTSSSAARGADRLYGWSGDDTLDGGAGDDRVLAHDGADVLHGGTGDDELLGGVGDDRLYAEAGDDQLFGEGGDDRLYADYSANEATLHGGNGDDLLVTDDGLVDHVFGDAGTDTALADDADELDGVESSGPAPAPAQAELARLALDGTGLLKFKGTDAAEEVSMRVDGRRVLVTVGTETRGFDVGRVLRIEMIGDGGDDRFALDPSIRVPASMDGGLGNDRLVGGSSNDTIRGFDGDDSLDGGAGDDTLYGGVGADTVNGGGGDNFADYDAHAQSVLIDLAGAGDVGADRANRDAFSNIRRARGGSGDDVLVGSGTADTLDGGSGLDTILGRGGDDELNGGRDEDYIEGGAGDDHLDGGRERDRLFGLAGNDRILSNNDSIEDTVRGGDGDDSAEADNFDDVIGVESVQ